MSDHYFDSPVDSLLPIAQVTMFLAVACSVMMGVSRRFGDFIMKMLAFNLRVAFEETNAGKNLTLTQDSILTGLPRTIETALAHFDLGVKTTTFEVQNQSIFSLCRLF